MAYYPEYKGTNMRKNNAAAVLIGFLGLTVLSGVCPAAEKKQLKNETARINYSVGYQIGGDFKAQGVELDPDVLVQGIRDALKKMTPCSPGRDEHDLVG
jgi:FKBP-type peptidyl-prolyl cis-trans isomerase FklB